MFDETNQRLDKTIVSIGKLGDAGDERTYWRSQSPEARLSALELMRQITYGYDPASERLQRVFEIIRRTSS